jgi:hypothetical protein
MCSRGIRCHEGADSNIVKAFDQNINNLLGQVILHWIGELGIAYQG